MQGMIEQAQAASQQAPQAASQGVAQGAPQLPPGANPNAAMRVEVAAKRILAQPDVAAGIIERIKAAQDPVMGVAEAVVFVLKMIFEKSQGKVPPQALMQAARSIILDVVKVATRAGVKPSVEFVNAVAQAVGQLLMASARAAQQTTQAQGAPHGQPQQQAAPDVPPLGEEGG